MPTVSLHPPPPRGLTYSSHLWERTSISLPDVLPATASEKLRHRCVMKSIKSIKEMTGKWESKLRLLNSCFDSTVATHLGLADVQRTMDDLLSPAWAYDLAIARGLDGAIVTITDPPTAIERESARYLEMQLQHNPAATIPRTQIAPILGCIPGLSCTFSFQQAPPNSTMQGLSMKTTHSSSITTRKQCIDSLGNAG